MHAQLKIKSLLDQLNTVIVGKSVQVQDCVACLLAGGHLLIEDVPGVGKTTLAHALARTFGLQFSRVQFTADLMPSDLSGVAVFERSKEAFVFHPGPVFAQVLLADEINRASPKTQSALLEAMEEKQVTVEGETRALPSPFFVIATQNPHDQLGTYALPESQMDRFLMRISLGYPDRQAERQLLAGSDRRDMVTQLQPLLAADELQQLQLAVQQVHVADPLLDYVQDLIAAYRELSRRCDYPLHLGLTEAGMGSKGIVASTAAMAVLLQEGIGDTIRLSLTPEPGGDRTREVIVAQELLQTMGFRSFAPLVTACPGCGRTTSTTFQSLAASIQAYLREQMPVWKSRYPGVEAMDVAVMGCVVNGPGESKMANIGISLPGTGETPVAPVYEDGVKTVTLKGGRIAEEFQQLVEAYVRRTYGAEPAGGEPDSATPGTRARSVIPLKVAG